MSKRSETQPAPDDQILRDVLQDVLSRHFGATERIVELERRPSAYRTSFALEELMVSLDGASHFASCSRTLAANP